MNTEIMKHRNDDSKVREIKQPTAEEPLEVVIDRTKWHRGNGGPGSKLITAAGKMCCLGFDALACGLSEEDINLRCDPASTGFVLPGLVDTPNSFGQESRIDSDVCKEMMDANDKEDAAEEQREACLTRLAATIHRKFVFIN